MNKKTQVEAVREIFQFAIGIVFLISVFYFLYDSLIPNIEQYALGLQLENVAEHANYLISELYKSSSQALYSSLENTYLMPEKLGDYSYLLFFQNDQICSSIKEVNLERCVSLMIDSNYQGLFFSGGQIKIRINYNESYSLINIGN